MSGGGTLVRSAPRAEAVAVLGVQVGGQHFVVPVADVREVALAAPHEVRVIEGRSLWTLRGASVPLVSLGRLFGLEARPSSRSRVVVVGVEDARVGLEVDSVEGCLERPLLPLGNRLLGTRWFGGAALDDAGGLSLVLDVPSLAQAARSGAAWEAASP